MPLPGGEPEHTAAHERLDLMLKPRSAGSVLTSGNSTSMKWEKIRGDWSDRPTNPYAFQPYRATDRGITYEYDNVNSRWQSQEPQYLTLPPTAGTPAQLAATTTEALRMIHPNGIYSTHVQELLIISLVNTTLDASKRWDFDLRYKQNGGTGSIITGSAWATGRVAGNCYVNRIDLDLVLAPANHYLIYLDWTKVSTAGTLENYPAVVTYRLLG